MLRVSLDDRRARLARRHRLAPGHRAADVIDATTSMVCLHATDPSTVHLSAWARVDGMRIADLERALYADRSLVKHLAMRRTLFVFPRELLPAAQSGASDRVARNERRRLVQAVEAAGLHADGERWFAAVSTQVLEALADGRDATATELRNAIPLLQGSTTYGAGKSWGGQVGVGPRVLTAMSAAGLLVRGDNDGSWAVSRPRWTAMSSWLGLELARPTEASAVEALVERWLRAFGPGTEVDLKWWLGSTLRLVRAALASLDAVPVELDGGKTGYVLPDDTAPAEPVRPWAALLPPLDPTTMGWFEREWYLGPYKPQLFDSTGNGGPTAWWDGRIVGGWRQGPTGEVVIQLLEDVGHEARAALDDEAARLTGWLGGVRVLPRFPSPLSKQLGDSGA